MRPTPESDREHIAHMPGCIARIRDYTQGERTVFDGSSLVQDAVLWNLQTLTEYSQRLSDGAKDSATGIASLKVRHGYQTRACVAWSKAGAKRLFGYFEGGVFVLDALTEGLH